MLRRGLIKGNTLLIVLVLVVLGATVYISSKGKLNFNKNLPANSQTQNSYTLKNNNLSDGDTSGKLSTSDKITLILTSPLNGALLKSQVVTVKGKTSPEAEVFINDQSAKADAEGNFTLNLTLDEGSNTLVVTANDTEGNVVEQNLVVNVESF